MVKPPRNRGAWPAGLIGMLALVAGVETYVGRRGDTFSTIASAAWRRSGEGVAGAAKCRVVALGDSLVKHGVVSPVVAERTGRATANLAATGGMFAGHDFLLRRLLRAGARPDVLVVDGEMLVSDPYEMTRVWPELLTVPECAELARVGRDPAFFARGALAVALPTYRQRHEVGQCIMLALGGQVPAEAQALPVIRRNWKRNGGAQVLPDPHDPPGSDPVRDKVVREDYRPTDWSCHPVNDLYVHKFLARAEAHGLPVVWLVPPMHPEVEARRARYGRAAKYRDYLRSLVARHPNLTVVDGTGAGYPPAAMFDATHLSRAGALAFSEAVGRVVRDRLDGAGAAARPSAPAQRWLALPRYDAAAVATLASAAAVEDQAESGRNLTRVMQDVQRRRRERRLADAGADATRRRR